MTQALYNKWRPQSWEAVIGQAHVVQTLRNAIQSERVAHAYLFAGPRGTGKTTTARLLAKAVNCLEPDLAQRPCGKCIPCQAVNQGRFLDLIEIDAASNTSVDDVRDLRDKINFSPNLGRYKVYIIDEVHMLSNAAFNALLKTLEEPPAHALFILATTEIHKIPATVLSRCQRHEFRRIAVNDIVMHLQTLADAEKIHIVPEALTLLARQSTGAMRDAISLLDQLASTDRPITLQMVQNLLGTATEQSVLDLIDSFIAEDARAGLDLIHQALDAGSDPRQFARQVVDYLRNLLLIRTGNADQLDDTPERRAQMARHSQSFTTSELLSVIRVFNDASSETRGAWQPALPLEMAFIDALHVRTQAVEPVPEVQPAKTPAARTSSASHPAPGASGSPPKTSAPAILYQSGAAQPESTQKSTETRPTEETTPPKATKSAETTTAINTAPAASSITPADELFKKVTAHWRQIVHQVGQESKQTQALLNSCKPFGVKEGVLYLGFNGPFSRDKMEKGEHVEITQKALAQVLDLKITDIALRCFVATGNQNSLPADVESDGMVATALRDLGGEIVDIK